MIKKASLKDIAQKAGVSTTLVSYVLNNRNENRINKETAQKIRKVADKLNYHTNQIAKSLKTNKTYTIGCVLADIANPFSANMARIIEDEADKQNYTVIFGSSDENARKSEKLINTLINRQVDGLILSLPDHSEQQLRHLQKAKIPFVLLDRYFPEINCNYVILDNYRAAMEATGHMIESGRKKIALITYESGLVHLQERKTGYLEALKQGGIKFEKNWLKRISVANNATDIKNAIDELLAPEVSVDAILFATSNIATCGLRYLNKLPVKIPGELGIISFDQTPMLDIFYSPVTFIKQPLQQMGEIAVNLLFEKLKNEKLLKEVKIKGELIIQESTMVKGD